MKRNTRRHMIYSLIFIFLLFGGAAVFYAQGWRISLSPLSIDKVGAIYIKTFPKDTVLTLDGKPIKKSFGLLESGKLINNLFPKKYFLEAQKDGFLPWQSTVEVHPAFVEEFKYAVLVPTTRHEIASGSLATFSLFDTALITKTTTGTLAIDRNQLRGDMVIGMLGSQMVLTQNTTSKRYFAYSRESKITIDLGAPELLLKDIPSQSRMIIRTKNGLAFLEIKDLKNPKLFLPLPATTTINMVAPSDSFVAVSTFNTKTNTSRLMLYDKINTHIITPQKDLLGKTVELLWDSGGNLIILEDTGDVLGYNADANEFTSIASDGRTLALAQNGALAVLGNQALEIFFPKGTEKEYARFVLPNIKDIQHLEWYEDTMHLFMHLSHSIMFFDTEDKNLERFLTVAETPFGTYDRKENRLLFIDKGSLFSIAFP